MDYKIENDYTYKVGYGFLADDAKWYLNGDTITFNANGETVSETARNVAEGSQYGSLPVPTRTDYTFIG